MYPSAIPSFIQHCYPHGLTSASLCSSFCPYKALSRDSLASSASSMAALIRLYTCNRQYIEVACHITQSIPIGLHQVSASIGQDGHPANSHPHTIHTHLRIIPLVFDKPCIQRPKGGAELVHLTVPRLYLRGRRLVAVAYRRQLGLMSQTIKAYEPNAPKIRSG